jgi:hypothetical protein
METEEFKKWKEWAMKEEPEAVKNLTDEDLYCIFLLYITSLFCS